MYNILPELYREVVVKILDEIGSRDYYSGSFDFESEDVSCRIVLSAVIYRDNVHYPEGEYSLVKDIVPVWWEFHTYLDGNECLNNFSFNELREYIAEFYNNI